MKVSTIQIALAKRKGIPYFDITIMTGNKLFSPTWQMVKDYKAGKLSKEDYTTKYLELMRKSYNLNKDIWNNLLTKDAVLACYCKAGEFCHRLILADILVKLGAKYIGEVGG